jgi:hypothetical protein
MSNVRVKYIGAADRFSEVGITGQQQVWRKNEAGYVAAADAALLLASGQFVQGAGSLKENMRKLALAMEDGEFPLPMAAVTTATFTGDWTPTAVTANATAEEKVLTLSSGSMSPGDIVSIITPPASLAAGVAMRFRYLSATTVGIWFQNNNGTNAALPAGTWTVTVSRFAGGLPVDAPIVTMGSANAASQVGASGVIRTVAPNSGLIRMRHPYLRDAAYDFTGFVFVRPSQNSTKPSGRSGSVLSSDYVTEASKFDIVLLGNGVSMQVIVDGKIVTPAPLTTPLNFQVHRVHLDFTQGGTLSNYVRKSRTIRVEVGGYGWFGGVTILKSDTIAPLAKLNSVKAGGLGDSWVEGQTPYHPMRPTTLCTFDGFAGRLGDLLGWDTTVVCGVGGTGYLSDSGTTYKYRDRINDLISLNLDAGFIWGSSNDTTFPAAAVKAEAVAFYTQLSAAMPNTPFFVFGVQSLNTATATSRADHNAAIKAAIAEVNAPNIWFIDMLSPTPWIAGTGRSDARTNDGNADWAIGQNDHPTWEGHTFVAHKAADPIRSIVKSFLA